MNAAAHDLKYTLTYAYAAQHQALPAASTTVSTTDLKKDIAGGAQVYATNPWTHKTIAYTVKASGKRVVVHKK